MDSRHLLNLRPADNEQSALSNNQPSQGNLNPDPSILNPDINLASPAHGSTLTPEPATPAPASGWNESHGELGGIPQSSSPEATSPDVVLPKTLSEVEGSESDESKDLSPQDTERQAWERLRKEHPADPVLSQPAVGPKVGLPAATPAQVGFVPLGGSSEPPELPTLETTWSEPGEQSGRGVGLGWLLIFALLVGALAGYGAVKSRVLGESFEAAQANLEALETKIQAEVREVTRTVTNVKETVTTLESVIPIPGPAGEPGEAGAAGPQGPTGAQGAPGDPCSACVFLQGSTPGTAQTGNFNITGTGIAGTLNASSLQQGGVAVLLQNSSFSGDVSGAYNSLAIGTGAVTSARIFDGTIADIDVASGAAIAYSKLALTGSVTNSDLAGSITDSKLSTIATAGKVSDTALSSNVSLLNANQTATGNKIFQNSANSGAAFQIQRQNSDPLFTADTTNNRLTVGNAAATTSADSTLFVVDSATTVSAPAGVNGGIYYDTTTNKFRCFEGGVYVNCVSSGGAVKLSDSTLGSSASSMDIQSIPSGYDSLKIVVYGRCDLASANCVLNMRVNNDIGSNYDYVFSAIRHNATVGTIEGVGSTAIGLGWVAGATAPANTFSSYEIEIPNYENGANHKTSQWTGAHKQGSTTAGWYTLAGSSWWKNSSAINRLTFFPDSGSLVAGSRVIVYGVGGNASAGSSTLQQAYANSSTNELVLNSTQGGLTIQDASTPLSGNLFEVQNNAGTTNYFTVKSTGVTTSGNLSFTNPGNSQKAITVAMTVTVGVSANDVVVIDTNNAGQVTTTGTQGNTKVFGVATAAKTAGQVADVAVSGVAQVNVDTSAVNIGDFLITSTTAGQATPMSSPAAGSVIGRALSTKAGGSSGTVWAQITPGLGGGGGSSTGSQTYGMMESDWVTASGTLPANLSRSSIATVGNNVYLFGGNNGTAATNVIYSAPISNPTSWTNTGATLPGNLQDSQLAIVGGTIYLFGGHNGTAVTNVIYSAPVSTPTVWSNTGATLPTNLSEARLAVVGSNVYLFGGHNGTSYTNVIYRAAVATPTTWVNTGSTLPGTLADGGVAVIGGYVYLFGGSNGSAYTNVIYRAPVSAPTTWANTGATLPGGMGFSTLSIIGNYVYLVGGFNGAGAMSNVIYRASLQNPVNSWANTGSVLPATIAFSSSAVIGNAVYLFGNNASSAIYSAPIYTNTPDVSSNPSWIVAANGGNPIGLGSGSPAGELAYAQFTSTVSVTAISEATANTVIMAPTINFDGSTSVVIEFFAPLVRNSGTDATEYVLYDGSSSLGLMGQSDSSVASKGAPVALSREITPSTGAHTYSIRSYVNAGTTNVFAGTGGVGSFVPGFIRITTANGGPGSGSGIQNTTALQTGNFNLQSGAATSVGAIVRGASAQSADLFQVQDGAGVNVAVFAANGRVGIGNNTPGQLLTVGPASLSASQSVGIQLSDMLLQSTQAGSSSITTTTTAGSNGNLVIQPAASLYIQKAGGIPLLIADTVNLTVTLGSPSATPVLLVLGNKNTAGDPATCTAGAVYYNSSSSQFRGCANGAWNTIAGDNVVTSVPTTNIYDGRKVRLRTGAIPYDFLTLTYDATYGKWVSEEKPVYSHSFTAPDSGDATWTSGGAGTRIFAKGMLYYAQFVNSGLRLQVKQVGAGNTSVGVNTNVIMDFYTANSDQNPTTNTLATGAVNTGFLGQSDQRIRDSGWYQVPTTIINDFLFWRAYFNTTAAGTHTWFGTGTYRWVSP